MNTRQRNRRDTIAGIIAIAILCGAILALTTLSGCAGTVNEVYIEQSRDFNSIVVPELLDGYTTNPGKTELEKQNITGAVNEHLDAVEKWGSK